LNPEGSPAYAPSPDLCIHWKFSRLTRYRLVLPPVENYWWIPICSRSSRLQWTCRV